MSRQLLLLCAVALAGMAAFPASDTSSAASVFINTKSTSLWRTGVSATFDLPVEYPPLASSVDISVKGVRYASSIPGVTSAVQTVTLPAPESDSTENVYEITLAFNDGTTNRCAFALVRSQSAGASCPVRLVSASRWSRISSRKVMPMPEDCSLSIDAESVSTGLDGARGWFACPKMDAGEHEFALSGPDGDVFRTMLYAGPGCVISVR